MASKLVFSAILVTLIKLTLQEDLGVSEILNVDERDLSQLLSLLQGKGVSDMRNKGHKNLHHNHDEGDLNIQTLNLIMKRNGAEEDAKGIADRICKKTGRCGCSGGRCGRADSFETNDDVDEIVREIQKLLDRDQGDDVTRCGGGRCGHDSGRSKSDVDLKQLEKYGKKYKINEDLDAIVVDIDDVMKSTNVQKDRIDSSMKFNSDIFFDNRDLKGLVLNDDRDRVLGIKGIKSSSLDKKSESSYKVKDLLGFNNLLKGVQKNPVSFSPEDLVEFYEVYKRDVAKRMISYLRDPSANMQHIRHLPSKQQSMIERLKLRVLRGNDFSDQQLEKLVLQIIFGNLSHSKVLPHDEKNDNIYIPKWVHKAIEESLSQKYLRASKRLLPLTQQQKLKLQKNNQRTIWRRGFGPNAENVGVPFDLTLHGLGQAIP